MGGICVADSGTRMIVILTCNIVLWLLRWSCEAGMQLLAQVRHLRYWRGMTQSVYLILKTKVSKFLKIKPRGRIRDDVLFGWNPEYGEFDVEKCSDEEDCL